MHSVILAAGKATAALVASSSMALGHIQGPRGSATCFGTQGYCLVDAISLGQTPARPLPSTAATASSGHSSDEKSMQAMMAACRATYSSPAALGMPRAKGGWYFTPCARVLGFPSNGKGPLTFVPDAAIDPPVLVLASRAEQELRLPTPVMFSSPGPAATVPKVVNLPTWAWIARSTWAPISASASAPGVTVMAVATPYTARWSWGDGSSTVCLGPGTPYVARTADSNLPSPDCGHTYTATSKSGPGQRDTVTAEISWRVSWSASTGQSGTFPVMTSRASQAWPVEEIDALAVPGRSA